MAGEKKSIPGRTSLSDVSSVVGLVLSGLEKAGPQACLQARGPP